MRNAPRESSLPLLAGPMKITKQRQARLDLAQKYLSEGLILNDIAKRLGISKPLVEKWLGAGRIKRDARARHYVPKELYRKAQSLLDCGLSYSQIASALNSPARPVTTDTIGKWVDRRRIKRVLPPTRTYNDYLRLSGDWVVSSDYHIPYTDVELIRLMITTAKKFKVRNLLVAGDFLDQAAFSTFFVQEELDFREELEGAREIFKLLAGWFTNIKFLLGNHDIRLLKLLQFKLGAEDFFKMISDKVQVSQYPYCKINNKWYITHPKNYSKIATRVAHWLNHREQCHVGVAHGHAMGVTYSPSGREVLFDTGGIFDQTRVEYKNLIDTTHANWISGFSLIYRDYLYQFPKAHTDWEFWLAKK